MSVCVCVIVAVRGEHHEDNVVTKATTIRAQDTVMLCYQLGALQIWYSFNALGEHTNQITMQTFTQEQHETETSSFKQIKFNLKKHRCAPSLLPGHSHRKSSHFLQRESIENWIEKNSYTVSHCRHSKYDCNWVQREIFRRVPNIIQYITFQNSENVSTL